MTAQSLPLPITRRLLPPADNAETAAPAPRAGLLRWVLLSALVLVLGFTGLLGLISAGGYHNAELRALVTDPTCASPCWAGIVPGETTVTDAVTALEAHPWVLEVRVSPGKVSWWWNGEQPSVLDDSNRAFNGRLEIRVINGVERVASIILMTNAAFGDVQLALGQPDALTIYAIPASDTTRSGVAHVGEYAVRGITIFNLLECPITIDGFWGADTFIAFGAPTLAFDDSTKIENVAYKLPDGFFINAAPICG